MVDRPNSQDLRLLVIVAVEEDGLSRRGPVDIW